MTPLRISPGIDLGLPAIPGGGSVMPPTTSGAINHYPASNGTPEVSCRSNAGMHA